MFNEDVYSFLSLPLSPQHKTKKTLLNQAHQLHTFFPRDRMSENKQYMSDVGHATSVQC